MRWISDSHTKACQNPGQYFTGYQMSRSLQRSKQSLCRCAPDVAKEVKFYPTLSTSRWRELYSTFTFVRRRDSMNMSDQTQDPNLVGCLQSGPCGRHYVYIHAGIGTTPNAWYCGTLTHQNPPLPTPVVPSTRVTLLLQSLFPTGRRQLPPIIEYKPCMLHFP